MNNSLNRSTAVLAIALLGTGTASAALNNGLDDASNNTSVFIVVTERDLTNTHVRNLVIDSGVRTLDILDLNPAGSFATSAAQSAEIKQFLDSATGNVFFSLGGGLNDRSFSSDRYGFITTNLVGGPADGNFGQLSGATVSIDTLIGNTLGGNFGPNGVLKANGPSDRGWAVSQNGWGQSLGGTVAGNVETRFGQQTIVQGWRWDGATAAINNTILGTISSDLLSGQIAFTVVPVPAAVWLFVSALGLLGFARRRAAA
jgi:hypothetical protein